MLYYEQTLKL